MDNTAALKEFEEAIRAKCPDFKLKFKDRDVLQRVIGKVVGLFNPGYMTRYVTTLGHTVYFPTEKGYLDRPLSSLTVLAHEYVHMWDYQQKGFLFMLTYVLPQIIFVPFFLTYVALGCLFSFFGLPLLVLLAAVACLIPWPSSGRTHWELRGYTMSLAVEYWLTGRSISPDELVKVKKQFTSMAYYRMSWSDVEITKQLESSRNRILSGLEKDEPYAFVHKFLSDRGMVSGPRL
jgi:hypothetical protein